MGLMNWLLAHVGRCYLANPEFCAWVTLKEEHTFEGVGNSMTKLGRSRNLPEEDLLLAQLGVKAAT